MAHSLTMPGSRARRLAVTSMALTMVLATTGVADAGYTYSNTTRLYACVNKLSKVPRIVVPTNGTRACKTWETLVSWSKVGIVGPAGAAGAQGPAGAAGAQGPAGADGAIGPQGPQGDVGPVGPQGPAGGPQGDPGPVGPMGPAGLDGSNGTNGTDGLDGQDGATGPAGPQGAQGGAGPVGPQGPAGSNGTNGSNGAPGATGATGPAGPAGAVGATGATGPAGPALGGNVVAQSALLTSASTVKSAVASVSCAAGHVMLSGGGVVTTTDTLDKVRLVASYPSAAGTWTVTGSALIARGKTWSIRAYVVCTA